MPSLRTDQLGQYRTSVHGKRLAAGDTKVAVCTDCHSVHDLRAPSDPRSTVNPVNVASTCSRCHSDAGYMKGYSIPTDQFAKYSTSVHYQALAVRGDLSAPTCTTCHGNHGAAPPGVDRVQNVCSNCHTFQAQMYEKSSHKAAFQRASLPGCVVCHSNHGIIHPTDAKLGTGPDAVCMQCHTTGDACDQARAGLLSSLKRLDEAVKSADQVLGVAEKKGALNDGTVAAHAWIGRAGRHQQLGHERSRHQRLQMHVQPVKGPAQPGRDSRTPLVTRQIAPARCLRFLGY